MDKTRNISNMNNDINIADILRNCPNGMKLYSPVCGECRLEKVYEIGEVIMCSMPKAKDTRIKFNAYGKVICEGSVDDEAEMLLFPSVSMRDWSKFFKRGDMVYNPNSQLYAKFSGWVGYTYTEFNTTFNMYRDGTTGKGEVCKTKYFEKVNPKTRRYSSVIQDIEKFSGGKYNNDTLHVETDRPKSPIKPFDKVLVRDKDGDVWLPAFFDQKDSSYDFNFVMGRKDSYYLQCIPYYGNEHLLGTTNPYKEGGEK